ncbi:Ig-like domain-containing protein, partial [Mycobacterium tuberculosis]|uniref:Ig-like domain-containing protein n=1 Tax=Mycobacterium tuberculosis TaxID=1773 RepID=UPI001F279692
PFRPPPFPPVAGALVGVAPPLVLPFAVPLAARALAARALPLSSLPPVPGPFSWLRPPPVRWRPFAFWPA